MLSGDRGWLASNRYRPRIRPTDRCLLLNQLEVVLLDAVTAQGQAIKLVHAALHDRETGVLHARVPGRPSPR